MKVPAADRGHKPFFDLCKTGYAVDSQRQRFYDKEVFRSETKMKERMEEATVYGNQSEQS